MQGVFERITRDNKAMTSELKLYPDERVVSRYLKSAFNAYIVAADTHLLLVYELRANITIISIRV